MPVFQSCLVVLALAWGASGAADSSSPTNNMPPAAPRKPSIVMIVAEGLGWGDLGCYGQSMVQTPNLDELAGQGVRFTDFHAAGKDAQSRAALMTGVSPLTASGKDVPTLADQLKASGYFTGFMGYWGLGSFGSSRSAHRNGFAQFAGYENESHSRHFYTDFLNVFDPDYPSKSRVPLLENSNHRQGLFVPDLVTKAAVNFCRINKPELLNKYRPFFLVVSYPLPAAVAEGEGPMPPDAAYSGKSWPQIQENKALAISRLDAYVGQILAEVDKAKITDNTIVVFTSTGGPNRPDKCDPRFFKSAGPYSVTEAGLVEGDVRVPLIVRWPFWIRTPKTVDLLTVNTDLAPTLLEMAHAKPLPHTDGISLLPVLLGQEQTNHHDHLIWRPPFAEGGVAVRQGKWRAEQNGTNAPFALYDLSHDPSEKHDVATNHPAVLAKLRKLLSTDAGEPEHSSKPGKED